MKNYDNSDIRLRLMQYFPYTSATVSNTWSSSCIDLRNSFLVNGIIVDFTISEMQKNAIKSNQFYIPVSLYIVHTYIDVYKRQHTHTHTHTIRVISGLTHVYFLTFARFLNGKCRNPHQHNTCKSKRWPAWTVIGICGSLGSVTAVSYTHLFSHSNRNTVYN